jgi:hypothetical protein
MTTSTPGREVVVRGWWAVTVVLAAALAVVLNAAIWRSALPAGGREAVERALATEYRIRRLAGVDLPSGASRELAEALARLNDVSVRSVRAKGWGFNRIARVEVTVAGGQPPDGRSVRYLHVRCGPIVECLVVNEVSRAKYWLGLWFVEPAVAGFPTVRGRPGL